MAFYVTAPSVAFAHPILTLIGRSFRANLQGYTSGPVPFTLTRTGTNNWTATFSAPVLNAPPLVLPQCYVFSPSLEVRQIVPVLNGFGQATAVNITTLEQGPFTYTLTIYGTESV
jgi:hypothetical protein